MVYHVMERLFYKTVFAYLIIIGLENNNESTLDP